MYFLGKYVNRCYLEGSGALGSCCVIDSDQSTTTTTTYYPVTIRKTTTTQPTTELTISATSEYTYHGSSKVKVDSECKILPLQGKTLSRKRRVVGGRDVADSEHPWAVRILLADSDGNDQNICGGTLLNNGWVLSAAHCFQDVTKRRLKFGIYNPVSGERLFYRHFLILSHPNFDMNKGLANDAALVKLHLPEGLTDQLITACVSPTLDIDNLDATVAGWGREVSDVQSQLSQDLKEIDLQIYPNAECIYEKTDVDLFEGDLMVCAGNHEKEVRGQSTCKGDSGSGLIVGDKAVVGVVSWGFGCGERRNRPTVFQRLSPIYPWISQIINSF